MEGWREERDVGWRFRERIISGRWKRECNRRKKEEWIEGVE